LARQSSRKRSSVHTHSPPDGGGGVFFWEGILKFVYTNQGVGRFAKLGIPFPHETAFFVACLELVGGLLLISGLGTRLIAIPFVIEMIVVILTTKISLYLGTSPLPLSPALPKIGIWAVLHEIRSDYAQILTTAFGRSTQLSSTDSEGPQQKEGFSRFGGIGLAKRPPTEAFCLGIPLLPWIVIMARYRLGANFRTSSHVSRRRSVTLSV
jgi:hypothetical protein